MGFMTKLRCFSFLFLQEKEYFCVSNNLIYTYYYETYKESLLLRWQP